METVTTSPKYQVVILKRLRRQLGLCPGQKVQAIAYENRIELVPVRPVREIRGFQRKSGTVLPNFYPGASGHAPILPAHLTVWPRDLRELLEISAAPIRRRPASAAFYSETLSSASPGLLLTHGKSSLTGSFRSEHGQIVRLFRVDSSGDNP